MKWIQPSSIETNLSEPVTGLYFAPSEVISASRDHC